ncbi:MAG: hypothetical protein GXP43_03705 [bacterium]|nr:hypothetical protein [bacterium]
MVKIAVSGGHHTSALVIAKTLKQQGHSIVWFGHKHTLSNDTAVSAEYNEVTAAGIDFNSIKPPKLFNLNPILYSLKSIPPFVSLLSLWRRLGINLFLGFGGYLMVPCAITAFITKTPFFIHEQTQIAGRANLALSPLAKQIFVSWPITYPFPKDKTVFTGLPLRSQFLTLIKKPNSFPPLIDNSLPTILITAGKQGSHFINQIIDPLIIRLLGRFNLIHQTGQSNQTKDHLRFKQLQTKLQKLDLPGQYLAFPYLDSSLMMRAYRQASLIISRAGAHTTYELTLLNKPAILIPAAFVPKQEQLINANFLAKLKIGTILRQSNLTPNRLYQTILEKLTNPPAKPSFKINLPLDADQRLIKHISPYLKP